jgi:hypothetical protein
MPTLPAAVTRQNNQNNNNHTREQKAAHNYFTRGMVSKAYDRLTPAIQPSIAALRERLQSLHPLRQPENTFALDIAEDVHLLTPEFEITVEDVTKYFDKAPNLVSPGLSGKRADHIKQFIRRDDGDAKRYAQCITSIVRRMASGQMPEELRRFYSNGLGVALCKTADASGPVRPIVSGEVLRKVWAALLLKKVKGSLGEIFKNIQLGIGVPMGVEKAHHSICAYTALHQDADVCSFDIRNAYGNIFRKKMLEQITLHCPILLLYFHDNYAHMPEIIFRAAFQEFIEIQSQEGGFQGDVLLSLFYALGYQPVLNMMQEVLGDGIIKAVVDDTVIAGPQEQCLDAIRVLSREGPLRGVHLQPSKTRVLLGPRATAEDALLARAAYADALSLTEQEALSCIIIHPTNAEQSTSLIYGFRFLGTPFGTAEFRARWLDSFFTGLEEEATRLILYPHLQERWIFLSMCFQSKVIHLMRVIPPLVLNPYLRRFEELKRGIFRSIIDVPVTDTVFEQARLPIRSGGFGLTDMLLIAPAAFVASHHGAREFLEITVPGYLATASFRIYSALAIKLGFNTALTYASRGLQREILRKRKDGNSKAYLEQFMAMARPEDKARMLSLQDPKSGASLRAVPSGKFPTSFSTSEFRVYCLVRLGVELPFLSPTLRCSTCRDHPFIGTRGEHFHVCRTGGQQNNTHDTLAKEFVRFFRSAGVSASLEPMGCFPIGGESGRRPDVRVRYDHRVPNEGMRDLILDVRVTNPQGATNIERNGSSEFKGASAQAAFSQKNVIYGQLAEQNGLLFSPIIFESLGLWHPKVSEIVKKYSHLIADLRNLPYSVVVDYWIKRFSVILHKYQARMILERYSIHSLAEVGQEVEGAANEADGMYHEQVFINNLEVNYVVQ